MSAVVFLTIGVLETHVIIGAVVSVTTTVWTAVALFPEVSVTVQVTVVDPNGKVVGASLTTVATAQLSAVTGVPKTTDVTLHEELALKDKFTGAVIVGLITSIILTVKLHDWETLFTSVIV